MEIETVVKLLENLPAPQRARVVDHLREYVADLQDEAEWDELVEKSQPQLAEMARRAKQQIAEGLAKPLDENHMIVFSASFTLPY